MDYQKFTSLVYPSTQLLIIGRAEHICRQNTSTANWNRRKRNRVKLESNEIAVSFGAASLYASVPIKNSSDYIHSMLITRILVKEHCGLTPVEIITGVALSHVRSLHFQTHCIPTVWRGCNHLFTSSPCLPLLAFWGTPPTGLITQCPAHLSKVRWWRIRDNEIVVQERLPLLPKQRLQLE